MDWIFNNFEIVALVVLAIGSAVKQLVESTKAKREAPPRREVEEDEEDWFPIPIPPEYLPKAPPPLPSVPPPPPLLHKAVPPPVPGDTDEVLRRQLEMQEKLRQLRENKANKAKEPMLRAGQAKQPVRTPATAGVRSLLRHPSSARQAIVLREILGPPVGMR